MKTSASNDKKWSDEICKLANYICQKCKKDFSYSCYFDSTERNQYVCGHHIKHKKSHPELRYDLKNGLCVCKKCHLKIHS